MKTILNISSSYLQSESSLSLLSYYCGSILEGDTEI